MDQAEGAIAHHSEMSSLHPLAPFVPHTAVEMLAQLIDKQPIRFVIERHRRTKNGDYRPPLHGEQRHQITVNGSLNRYAFLITALHEYAHYVHRVEVGKGKLQAHGPAWKHHFQQVMRPFLQESIFPQPLLGILARHMRNPKASSTADHKLLEALKAFDDPLPVDHFYLHQLQEGDRFITEDGKLFQRGLEQRKRILCKRLTDGRMYLVHPFTEVKRIA